MAAGDAIREGSRWIHGRPSSKDFVEWFKTVKLHEGMKHEDYVGGITLIPGSEKVGGRGSSQYRDVFTPYAKVETRVAYFWDLCASRGWIGEIEPIIPKGAMQEFKGVAVPEPFYLMPYQREDGNVGVRLAATMQVHIFDPTVNGKGFHGRGREVMVPNAGTKVGKFAGDEHATARVETGAVGRALGFAGMLVIPGSGVATAEDMQEVVGITPSGEDAALPGENGTAEPTSLREQVAALRQEIESDFPGLGDELETWAQGRKINLNEIQDTQLRAVHKQMEKVLETARADA
jgi:hypothetical protein